MTNNQLTKEWLQNRIADMESTRDDIPFGFDESGNNELAAFKLALAAMDSEPVIADCDPEVYEKGVSVCLVAIPKETAEVICQNITAATGCKVDWHYFGGRVHIKALRAASQPAPVVPDESYQQLSELYHAQEKRLFKIAQRIKGPTFDKYSHSPSQAIDVLEAVIFGEDDACRAAMLATVPQSPGSEPATVPGKWIPASERMPEPNKFVLVSNGVWVGQGLYDDSEHLESDEHWQDEHREFINVLHHPVTHWMPLPAAPQENN